MICTSNSICRWAKRPTVCVFSREGGDNELGSQQYVRWVARCCCCAILLWSLRHKRKRKFIAVCATLSLGGHAGLPVICVRACACRSSKQWSAIVGIKNARTNEHRSYRNTLMALPQCARATAGTKTNKSTALCCGTDVLPLPPPTHPHHPRHLGCVWVSARKTTSERAAGAMFWLFCWTWTPWAGFRDSGSDPAKIEPALPFMRARRAGPRGRATTRGQGQCTVGVGFPHVPEARRVALRRPKDGTGSREHVYVLQRKMTD